MTKETLLVVVDSLFNGYKDEALGIISIFALFLGIVVIIIKNPISSLIGLIGLFATIAVYLILVGLDFIGFSYLIVYIGAVSILFLFILMLINIRTSELLSNNVNSIPLALLIIILLNYTWFQVSPESIILIEPSEGVVNNYIYTNIFEDSLRFILSIFNYVNYNISNVMYISSNNWDGYMTETNHAAVLGMILYTTFNMWLLMASIILLLAMVGAIVITIKPQIENNDRGVSSMVEHLFYTQSVKGSNPLLPSDSLT
jgi:NADH-ubiquinone oxidoreductase chain 6